MRRLAFFFTVCVLAAIPAAAVTPHEIVEMKKVGVSDTVLLAIIDRDQTIFTLDAKDLADLQREGISERVILAMLRSGREQRPAATATPSAPAPAAVAPAAPAPVADPGTFAIVGHDPDYPGTGSSYTNGPMYYTTPDFYGGYYGVVSPFFVPGVRAHRAHPRANVQPVPTSPSGPFLSDPMRRFETPIVTLPPAHTGHRAR